MNLWREKVVSPSYSSAILGLPPSLHFKYHPHLKRKKKKRVLRVGKIQFWMVSRKSIVNNTEVVMQIKVSAFSI